MGGIFTYFMWLSYQRSMETRQWPSAEAMILSSQVLTEHPTPHSPVAYTANIRYRFIYEGKTYESRRVTRSDGSSNKKPQIQAIVEAYPVGLSVTCFVNTSDPSLSVLRHTTKAGLYTIWFPLLFVVGGMGICASAFKKR